MPNLQDLREQVRTLLDEQEAVLFSDAEIDREINKGAVHMTRATQCLQYPFQKTTEANKSEYGTIAPTTDVISVCYFDGNRTYKLRLMRASEAQVGNQISGSRPTHYYLKPYISQFAELDSTNALALSQINTREINDWRTVIGIWPPPSEDGRTITINAYISHPKMVKDTDQCLLPDGYEDGPIYFSTFKGLLKQKFYSEAKTYQDLYASMEDSLADYVAQASSVGFPTVGITDMATESDPYQDLDSRVWVD